MGTIARLVSIARLVGTAIVAAAAALGTAPPSTADDVMEGQYNFSSPGLPPAVWTIYPLCVPTVGDLREPLQLPVACTLKVVSATDNESTYVLKSLNWGGDARLTGGQWTLITHKDEGFLCPDGTKQPSVDTYKFDDVTLTGEHTLTHTAVCGVPAGMTKEPFTLAYANPLPIPVDRYPLVCEPAGNRLCR